MCHSTEGCFFDKDTQVFKNTEGQGMKMRVIGMETGFFYFNGWLAATAFFTVFCSVQNDKGSLALGLLVLVRFFTARCSVQNAPGSKFRGSRVQNCSRFKVPLKQKLAFRCSV
jgi:hypothetical protein